MKFAKWIVWAVALHFVGVNACASASPPTEADAKEISASDMAAFARVIAEDPLGGQFPYNVRAVVYANPNDCFESPECENVRLFLAVIGDGELPDYKVYDAGNAGNWEFIRWAKKPSQFFDDERNSFVIELVKTVPCKAAECDSGSTRKVPVKARVSLFGFEWVD